MQGSRTDTPRLITSPRDLLGLVGTCLGTTGSHRLDQEQVDQFAATTGDRQWIHVDRERARRGPFGTTVVHGYLTLSLLPVFLDEVFHVGAATLTLNYGLNRVRFPAPLRVGSSVCATVDLVSAELAGSDVQAVLRVTVQEVGAAKPCCVADTVLRYVA